MRTNLFDVKEKVILVVGGTGYLGEEVTKCLAENEAIVYCSDIEKSNPIEEAKEYHREIKNKGKIIGKSIDVTDEDSVSKVIKEIVEVEGRIDVFINFTQRDAWDFWMPFTKCSVKGWKEMLEVNLTGAFVCCREVGKLMEKQGYGNMINIGSAYGIVANDQRIYKGANLNKVYGGACDTEKDGQIYSHSAYATTKAGIIMFTKYLAAYWGNKNIRVNCIAPGGVKQKDENKEFYERYSAKVPLGRKANRGEINGAVIFLASDASSYITGHTLVVDGGFTIW